MPITHKSSKIDTAGRGPSSQRHRGARLVRVGQGPTGFEPGRCVGMPKVYGRVLALARESLGVSQTALGRELEVQPSAISRLEKGLTTLPVYFLDHVAIALTGFALIWSTRLYPSRASFGVGLSFFTIAAGQALGAPVVGWTIGVVGPVGAFCLWALISPLGAAVGPRSR